MPTARRGPASRRRLARSLLTLGCAAAWLGTPGCAFIEPARPHPVAPPPAPLSLDVVPGDGVGCVDRIVERLDAERVASPPSEPGAAFRYIDADGAERTWRHADSSHGELLWRRDAETGNTRFLFAWRVEVGHLLAGRWRETMAANGHGPGEPDDELSSLDEHYVTAAVLRPPVDERPPRGLLLFASSWGGPTRGERALITVLRRRGWAVLDLRCPTPLDEALPEFFAAPPPPGDPHAPAGDETPPPATTDDPPADAADREVPVIPDKLYLGMEAAVVATIGDVHVMTSVHALRAIRQHLPTACVDVPSTPSALVGVSYGAVAAPAMLGGSSAPTCAGT
jgi:hypothetical protein